MIRVLSFFILFTCLFFVGFSLAETDMPQNKQTWNLKNADIRAVIQTVSILTGKNFIIDPRVRGNITFISQHPMSTDEVYQAFISMLEVLGYSAIPSGHNIKIVPSTEAKAYGGTLASRAHPGQGDEVVVRVISVNNVSARQLTPVIRTMMQPWASVRAYVPANSLILIGAASNISRITSIIHRMDNKSANITSVVSLRHANASNLVNILSSLQNGSRIQGRAVNVAMAADNQSNSVLLNGNLENITRMKHLIHRLDRPIPGGNTLVIHLNYLNAKKLAPVLFKVASSENAMQLKGRRVALGAANVSVEAEENDNAIILHGPAALLHSLRKVIRQLDRQPRQVLVEAIIVKIDQSLLNQLGIVWGTVDSRGNASNVVDSATGVALNNPTENQLSTPNTFAMRVTNGIGFISSGNLGALIHALKSNASSDILATPSIVVLNNKEASIADGKNIGIVNRQYSSTVEGTNNEVTPFNTIQRKDVTLSLKVTPQISPNHMVRLKIEQQNNSIDSSSMANINNPILDVSKITTNVLVRSGDILVLGGLINDNHITGVQKLPILGDIPLLGHLFRYKSQRVEKQNLMVFIKPVILNNPSRSHAVTRRRYHYIRAQQIAVATGRKLHAKVLPVLPPYRTITKEQTK